jgi:hypothetical protein
MNQRFIFDLIVRSGYFIRPLYKAAGKRPDRTDRG